MQNQSHESVLALKHGQNHELLLVTGFVRGRELINVMWLHFFLVSSGYYLCIEIFSPLEELFVTEVEKEEQLSGTKI